MGTYFMRKTVKISWDVELQIDESQLQEWETDDPEGVQLMEVYLADPDLLNRLLCHIARIHISPSVEENDDVYWDAIKTLDAETQQYFKDADRDGVLSESTELPFRLIKVIRGSISD